MGGRGTFAAGKSAAYTYETVGKISGVKVLRGLEGKHGLPEEAHGSFAYIKLKPDGTFHEMRIYDKDHYLVREIAYHPEPNINNGNQKDNVLHVHDYPVRNDFRVRPPHKITKEEYYKYRKYFKGVPKIEKW